jgi:hypothetical protein
VPRTQQEAEQLADALAPLESEFLPLLRLGPAVPTANQMPDQEAQVEFYTLSPFTGGEASGTGNQNYATRLDLSLSERFQISGFYSVADDPLFAKIPGLTTNPANFWQSYGGSAQWQLVRERAWRLAITGSLEAWEVGSGGCDSFSCKGQNNASPNIFNNSGERVFTTNLVGSVALPISWDVNRQWQLTFTPGVSFLPATQGGGQGGAGTFYGNNVWFAGGAQWQPIPELQLFSSLLVPVGPGTNSFDAQLNFSRVPIATGGLRWQPNPRIGFQGALTNGFGATPATALLALPSSNRLGYTANFQYRPGGSDTPQPELGARRLAMASGGLTVNTALVPPAGAVQITGNADSRGNVFGAFNYSLSNIFQLELLDVGAYNQVNTPASSALQQRLANTYATDGGLNWRLGGKTVAFSPLRGAPFWGAFRLTFGRNYDADSFQGYVFAETISTWEATPWLALNVNPKIAWSGLGTPWGVGLSANVQLGADFQLIPELNIGGYDTQATNGTLALRWLAQRGSDRSSTNVDLYVSNAAGLLDLGQLLRSTDLRVGTRLSFTF